MDNLYRAFQDEVLAKERERIASQRANRTAGADTGGGTEDEPYTGLAISGGGIRSASFGLGVLQSLHKHGLLTRIDYLSTVSGGGYIGSALTWFRHLYQDATFPFGHRGYGARRPAGDTPDALDYIRLHGNYLKPRKLGVPALIGTALRVVLLTLSIYFALAVTACYGLIELELIAGLNPDDGSARGTSRPLFYVAAGAGGLFAAAALVYYLATWVVWVAARSAMRGEGLWAQRCRAIERAIKTRAYLDSIALQRVMAMTLALGVLVLIVASLPYAADWLRSALWYAGSSSGLIGVLGGIYQFLRDRRSGNGNGGKGNQVVILIAAALLIYGGLLVAFASAEGLRHAGYGWGTVGLAGLWVVVLAMLVNLNGFGIGRMYRDRLAEAFLPDLDAVEENRWEPARQSNIAPLSAMCSAKEPGPYHLLCCNVVLIDSDKARYRGRGGDSFVLAPVMSGSDATGWLPTEEFLDDDMTLATAMATSAAAANPHTGVSGQGISRNRLVSFLASALGLRLGFWARSPWAGPVGAFVTRFLSPSLLYPGIRQGLLGRGLNARAGYLSLTDGGHFENLALYELARRKVDRIIVSDAGVDPDFTLQNMTNAIERIRSDFGFNIEIGAPPYEDYGIDGLIAGSTDNSQEALDERFDLSARGFAIAKIDYGDKEGVLYWIKSTLVPGLPADVYGYKGANPAFPYQPTTDQFFDEAQFEAYRELGYRLCDDLVEAQPELLGGDAR